MPKISIIVAVYNQEDFISKCIESILNQTFQDFELLLINDGSQDDSGEIIDFYAEKDTRIRVIHQNNRGLAGVRNRGVRESRGDYIGFVDGDDWVDHTMFDILYHACLAYSASLSACFFNIYNEYYELVKEANNSKRICVYDSGEAIKLTYEYNFTSFNVWNKLFKKEIFDDIQFPENRAYEDEAILAISYSIANKVVVVESPLYKHYQRKSGITQSILNKYSEKKLDILTNYMETYNYMERNHPDVCELITLKHYRSCIDILMFILKDEKNLKENLKYIRILQNHIKLILHHFKENRFLTKKEKSMAIILAFVPYMGTTYYRLNGIIRNRKIT